MRSQRRNTVIDALGRIVPTGIEARRVVSLVPSETESVAMLVGMGRLVGRTSYCIEPVGQIETVPIVGGTKNVDLEAVRALAPDLVLANQEEGSRRDVERLIASGLRVHVSFPRTLAQSVDYLASLSALLGLDPENDVVRAAREELATARARIPRRVIRVWVPIWNDPWMSFDARTFASDVLAHAGLENVMAERARRYPLAADLGDATAKRVEPERDTRYPRLRLEEAMARVPDVVLLPDEPFRFTEAHAEEIRRASQRAIRVLFVDGKDLFWYGVRATSSPTRLRTLVET